MENKYDHIKRAVPIKVRSPLNRVLVSSLPAIPEVNQAILFEASSLPSSYGILYTWNFGDGSPDFKGSRNKISHAFKATGVYNVSVHANNTLSQRITWASVEVLEAISGVHLSYNGPNELNSVTEISGRVSTGSSLRWTFELGDRSVFKDLSKSSISHVYRSPGNYTTQVTVSNAVSRVRESINIEIYQLAIDRILPTECIVSGKEVNLQALVAGNVSQLIFHWHFGDGTPDSAKTGTPTILHTFSSPGNHLLEVNVSSQAGSAHYQTNVCVEALITDLDLCSGQTAVAMGEEMCFDISVLPHGENYQFLWYNSSSSDSPVSGKSHHCFVFSQEGLGEIMVLAHNQVSHKTAKVTVFVERPIQNLSIRHEGKSGVLAVNQSYCFWTEPSQKGGAVEWDFGDGSPKREGQNQSHAFASAGRFRVTASILNAFSHTDVDVQVPVSNLVIHTNQPYTEAGQETVFTVVSNVMDNVEFYWTVEPLFPSKLGGSEYRCVFPTAGIFKVNVTGQNLVSTMEASVLIEVVERIQGVQITSQFLKSVRHFLTKEPIILMAAVMHGSGLTYCWLAHQDGVKETVGDGEHLKLFTNSSGNVSVKLTVANALGTVNKEVTLRAVERVSGVNISTPGDVITRGITVNVSVSVKTGTDLQYIWCLESVGSSVTSDVPFVLHVFKATGIFRLRVSVANVLSSVEASKPLIVQECISQIDFEVDGHSHPFFVSSNSLLRFRGFVGKGNVLHWNWTEASKGRNAIVLGNNRTLSTSFMDVGDHHITLNASNDISWQSISHVVTVEDAIQGLSLRASETVICENDAVTFTPFLSHGSGVSMILEFAGESSSLNVQEEFTISKFPIGNHTVRAIARNHVSVLSADVNVQVFGRVKGLHVVNCCSTVLEALKPFHFKASAIAGSQLVYQWSFQLNHLNTSRGPGQSVLYSPFSNGSLSVTVEASSATYCSQSITEIATVQWPVKKVRLVGSPDGPFVDHSITFSAFANRGSDLMFHWDFGDAEDSARTTISNTVEHRYKVKGRFVVQLTVFNNVSQVSAQLPVVVRELECERPEISLIQEQTKILKSMPSYFEASVELKGCVSYKTTYLWEIFHDPSCSKKKVALNSAVGVATPFLSLPKHTLEVGDYCLKFTTRFRGTPLEHHKTTKISVTHSPLVPMIKGGSHRVWSSQKDLILDGTQSFDPDFMGQQDDLLQFRWESIMVSII